MTRATNPSHGTVTVGGKQITSDQLIVSLGADYATDTIPGLQQAGETFATLSGAERLAPAVNAVTKGRVAVVAAAQRHRCPVASDEAALLIDAAVRHKGLRENVDVAIHAAEPAPMGVAGANVSEAVIAILTDRNIDYHSSHQITAAEEIRLPARRWHLGKIALESDVMRRWL